MANELTGDFDVVAEFAIPAANRVLAAMHRSERFLHSISVRVDDNARPGPPGDRPTIGPTIVRSVDTFGDPTVDPTRVRTPSGQFFTADRIRRALDSVVNPDLVGATVGPLVPSKLQGRAQLQLSPPTIEVPDGSGVNVRVHLDIMSRYFPDPQTPRLAEFIRGDLQLTAPMNQISSQTANVVDIDIQADDVGVNFNPTWSDRPLSAEDRAGINQAIRNALKTSFVPSNATLPSTIAHMQFKTLFGPPGALAVLLDTAGGPGNPSSAHNVFLGPGDDFAFAVGREFIIETFSAALHVPQQFQFDFYTWFFGRHHVVYEVTLNSATVDLQDGSIVVTIEGHAHTGRWWLPDFDFRARLRLRLSLAGATADIVAVPEPDDISVDILDGVKAWLVSLFKDRALPRIRQQREEMLTHTRDTVRRRLNADQILGPFLRSLLTRAAQPGPQVPPGFSLAYTSAAIRPVGIVLHGSLAVMDWPPARVEFQELPPEPGPGPGGAGAGGLLPTGPDYSALRTWIPGGTIQRYEWRRRGATQPFHIDEHKFVYVQPPPLTTTDTAAMVAMVGFSPICLTVRGTRIASSGPTVAQPVSASVCGYSSFPVVSGLSVEASDALPLIALTHPGPRGLVEVAGHTAATPAEPSLSAPNLLVHFADDKTADRPGVLGQALRASQRADAATAVLAVMSAEQMARARYAEGILYAEDQAGAWDRIFGVKTMRRPLTLIVAPNGKIVWQHEGEPEPEALAAALRRSLEPRRAVPPRVLRPAVRIGQLPPDFLFEYAPGRPLRLRKLRDPAELVFWKDASKVSIETARELLRMAGQAGGRKPVVLAINDGDAAELAKRVAAQHGLSAALVTDPQRRISLAYGVSVWPTIVTLDASGVVRQLRHGRLEGEHVEHPSKGTADD